MPLPTVAHPKTTDVHLGENEFSQFPSHGSGSVIVASCWRVEFMWYISCSQHGQRQLHSLFKPSQSRGVIYEISDFLDMSAPALNSSPAYRSVKAAHNSHLGIGNGV